ncbi:MAG: hypothetical protein AB7E27_01085 [Candidatus Methanomethylophilaceae archaeon]|jgi:hypothetical protein
MKTRCLWKADDDRCACCKAKRIRLDVLGMKEDYGICVPERDYDTCEFFVEKPVPPGGKKV